MYQGLGANVQTPRPTKLNMNEAYLATWGGIWNSAVWHKSAGCSRGLQGLVATNQAKRCL